LADNRLDKAVAIVKEKMAYGDWVRACKNAGIEVNAVYPKMLNARLVEFVWEKDGEKPVLSLAPKGYK